MESGRVWGSCAPTGALEDVFRCAPVADAVGAAGDVSFLVGAREGKSLSCSAAAIASTAWLSGFGSAAAGESPGGGAEAMVDGKCDGYGAQEGEETMGSESVVVEKKAERAA